MRVGDFALAYGAVAEARKRNEVMWRQELRGHYQKKPHWSTSVTWRDGRWDPLSNAPMDGTIMHVRGRDKDGHIFEPCHYAYGDGDGLMPPFIGWFIPNPYGRGYVEVQIIEWQPLWAKPEEAQCQTSIATRT